MAFLLQTARDPEDVAWLMEFAAAVIGMDTDSIGVHFKDAPNYGYSGRAYSRKPARCPFAKDRHITHYIKVNVGKDRHFPAENVVMRRRVLPWGTSEADAQKAMDKIDPIFRPQLRNRRAYLSAHFSALEQPRYEVLTFQPYGGRKAAYYVMHNWREAVVAITAHELTHIDQFRNNRRASEAECEAAALTALRAFRHHERTAS